MHSYANRESKPRLELQRSGGGRDSAATSHSSLLIGAKWRNRAKVYGCHLMASWGDRMWLFAIGLYMIKLYPESLKLTAIYGITLSASILVFGSFIGAWIDRTCRITAARAALIVQNSSVALCALLLIGVIMFSEQLASWGPWASPLSQALIVFIADIAALASEASRIILEKDWIVVIASDDRALLASYNSVLRAIDLGSNILAPTCVGFLMSWMSSVAAALVLCVWNVVSMILEYILLNNIFKTFPELATKNQEVRAANAAVNAESDDIECRGAEDDQGKGISGWIKKAILGWGIYFRHDVFAAGFGLALLYMTVLGFDHITTAFAYSQGVQPWILGIISGIGALNGMTGALCFPFLCRRLGLRRTGVLGFSLETIMLISSLVSIILPGSPFKYYTMQAVEPNQEANWTLAGLDLVQSERTRNCKFCGVLRNVTFHPPTRFNSSEQWGTVQTPPRSAVNYYDETEGDLIDGNNNGYAIGGILDRQDFVPGGGTEPGMMPLPDGESGIQVMTTEAPMRQDGTPMDMEPTKMPPGPPSSEGINISIIAFLGGIISARFGLWVADLTVTQILQERVREDQRGVINGIQTSMNQLLDLVKFLLVVMIPQTELFGFLIIASYSFVCMGWISFMVYCLQTMYRRSEPSVDKYPPDGPLPAAQNFEEHRPLQEQSNLYEEVPVMLDGTLPSHFLSQPYSA